MPGLGGLSPRTRGNPRVRVRQAGEHGSIPADAGEPPAPSAASRIRSVYPRARGGTRAACGPCPVHSGISPQTRGEPGEGGIEARILESIPTMAGGHTSRRSDGASAKVYPRAGGGLSDVSWAQRHPRFISARAGKTSRSSGAPRTGMDYPRARGGTPGSRAHTIT